MTTTSQRGTSDATAKRGAHRRELWELIVEIDDDEATAPLGAVVDDPTQAGRVVNEVVRAAVGLRVVGPIIIDDDFRRALPSSIVDPTKPLPHRLGEVAKVAWSTRLHDAIRGTEHIAETEQLLSARWVFSEAVAAALGADFDQIATILDTHELQRLGARLGREAGAALRWAQLVGDRIDTSQVTALLGISRQALAKRQRSGAILALPGDGTSWYPIWQFDFEAKAVRADVREIVGAFRERVDDIDPLVIAGWATTPQPDDLGSNETPAEWVSAGRDGAVLRRAAERAAARLAQ